MSHAAYVYDIEHVIVDNLQFMTSYLRYVLTHNSFYFRSFFFFLSLLQAPRWDAQRFWEVQCKKRLGAVERGSVGAYWSSSWYTFSLEASLPTTIVWTDHYQSSDCHQQNGQHETRVWFWWIHDVCRLLFPPPWLPLHRSRASYSCLTLFSRQPYHLKTWNKLLSFWGWSLH